MTEKRIRVFEAFAGIGTQRMALRNLGIPHDVVAISEIDRFAVKSYEAIHGKTRNLGDITKIDSQAIPDHELFTYSFPCQDISIAGRQKGFDKDSGTRSSLLWECDRIIKAKKPKYLMLENVKNLVGKKNRENFNRWLEKLESYGYTNYWQVLNAKDYGVPQNRERVFVISILGDHQPYIFPEKQPLTMRLKDVLEEDVDQKFYFSDERIKKLTWDFEQASSDQIKIKQVGSYATENRIKNSTVYRTFDSSGLSPTLTTMQGGGQQPHITIVGNTSQTNHRSEDIHDPNGIIGTVTASSYKHPKQVVIGASRGRNPNHPNDRTAGLPTKQHLEINPNGTSNTITTVQKDNYAVELPELRVRKLTPKECWRLMGCSDEDFNKAAAVNSNTQLYKQAGNAIVVNVLEALFKSLFSE